MSQITLLDCTLRDGGYYNNWIFPKDLVDLYLEAMDKLGVHVVELGFRSFDQNGFKGACAYTTDAYIRSLHIPESLIIAVMVNASELLRYEEGAVQAVNKLFDVASNSPVSIVRVACHYSDLIAVMPACSRLKEMGYRVGLNLMQAADRTVADLKETAVQARKYHIDILYFADSLGSLCGERTQDIVNVLRSHWDGPLGFHAHDNIGQALTNTLKSIESGVMWIDSTITGMGRGAGNVKTEYMVIELKENLRRTPDMSRLFGLIENYFKPLQIKYGWGTNTFYYLAGKNGIHPSYIQEMVSDRRYEATDILAVMDFLQDKEGSKFSIDALDAGRQMYGGKSEGTWEPSMLISGKIVLILGSGPSVADHRDALEQYIKKYNPIVIALNTQSFIDINLIHLRAAC